MKVASWNVNGIRAVERKKCLPWDLLPEMDVLCLQETKAKSEQVGEEIMNPEGWQGHWFSAERAGYSGTAIYCRDEPDAIIEGMGNDEYDCEGRVITARFGKVAIISAYFPNSQDKGKRIDYKVGFCQEMEKFLQSQRDAGFETLLMGDYNIAHHPIDLARPKQNEGSPGYLPQEREWMTHYLGLGYRDVFRERNPDLTGAYTWWTYRSGARNRNIGWRIDYGTTSPDLGEQVVDAQVHQTTLGSDHCPVSVEIKV